MTTQFKIGDKVRCVDDSCSNELIYQGGTYFVSAINAGPNKNRLSLEGIDEWGGWDPNRFVLVTEPSIPSYLADEIAKKKGELEALERQVRDIQERDAFRETCVYAPADHLDVEYDEVYSRFDFVVKDADDSEYPVTLTKEKALALAAYIQRKAGSNV